MHTHNHSRNKLSQPCISSPASLPVYQILLDKIKFELQELMAPGVVCHA